MGPDSGTLVTVASLITAFAVPVLFFRIERELEMRRQGMADWIPWADRLLVAAAWVSMLLVVLSLLIFPPTSIIYRVVPPAACGAAALCVVGYPLAILAHYYFYPFDRRDPPENPTEPAEPAERVVVIITVVAATVVSLWIAYTHG